MFLKPRYMMMKQIAFLFALLAPLGLAAQEHFAVPHITVAGSAHRWVAPDLMEWNVEVRSQGAEVDAVASEHRSSVQEVLKFLQDGGIDKKRIQTARMQLQENWQYRNGNRYRDGFIAITQVRFDSPSLDLYDTLWTGLANIKDVSINNVNLTLDEPERVRNEVKIEALKSARDQARAMAAALDTSLGEVLRISETRNDYNPPEPVFAMAKAEMDSGGGGSSLSPGQIEITAQVFVTFSLVRK